MHHGLFVKDIALRLDVARRNLKEGNLRGAYYRIGEILDQAPWHADALELLALIKEQMGYPWDAVTILSDAIRSLEVVIKKHPANFKDRRQTKEAIQRKILSLRDLIEKIDPDKQYRDIRHEYRGCACPSCLQPS